MTNIVERLHDACNGHPHAKIPWPHRLLHDARDEITRLQKALERLGSTEAMTLPFYNKMQTNAEKELDARIEYARNAKNRT